MKTNFPLKSKPKKETKPKLVIATVLFVLLAGMAFLFPNVTRSSMYFFSKPVWFSRNTTLNSFSGVIKFFSFKSTLVSQNQSLLDEIEVLKLKESDYDLILKENQDLKLEFGRKIDVKRIIARVVSKPPRSPYDTIVIDAGSAEGIMLGSKVYMGDNVIVGLVTNATPHTSLVEMFSTGNKKQDAVLSRTGTTYTLLGQGGANMKVEVPKDTDIIWGDTFIYPSLSSSIIGNVYFIDTNSQSSFKTVYIRIPGNVFSSKYLFVE